ncbi:MAG: (2Fe-2S)-binding protein [Acidobacteriaceae bacterium]|jgi:NADH-quinone oxidoreductase subunit G|nr:(2Fe-2S)-binding protein [Acidobacteriaceae bacterium]
METVTLTIDGQPITVEKGKTVLQAAIEHGISLPYYCYHPGIGIEGSCRVCIVKVEKMPKLQTSCSTVATDGMVVHTQSDDVVAARAGVFEFLLVNHPLDCPVCDKGGECPLQDFSYTYGPARSRMEFPRRVFDGEGVKGDVDFGPTLMLNRQRCILCTRCVRFMEEVEGDAQIGVINRGNGSEIATFRDEGVHTLLSGNLMDVCPVGAITTKAYRFKSRPWDNPVAADSICTNCAKGCNTTHWLKAKPEWAKGSRLIRLTPRYNPDVNDYWMCDLGRFGYHWIESDDRVRTPLVKNGATLQPLTWHDALAKLSDNLTAAKTANADGVRFLLSAHASHEELFLFRRIAETFLGSGSAHAITVSWRTAEKPQSAKSTFKIPAVDAPNVNGARLLGLAPGRSGDPQGPAETAALRALVEAGKVSALYVFDPGPDGSIGDTSWIVAARASGRLPLLIVQGVLMTDLSRAADIVLPGATSAEKQASYSNEQGRLQGTSRALPTPGEALEDWNILTNLATALGLPISYATDTDVRAEMATLAQFDGIGALAFAQPVSGKTWLEASNPSERWKWEVMYQDLPPVKGTVEPSSLPPTPGAIPLREVK